MSERAASLVESWDPVPVRRKGWWLRGRLVDAIRSGLLETSAELPGARDLAAAVGVSRGTVDAVYAQLADEGFVRLAARQRPIVTAGSGPRPPTLTPPTSSPPPPSPGVPDAALFPHRAWLTASRTALHELAARDLGYPDPSGHPALRTELARWLTRTRGLVVTPNTVHVTSGTAQAMWLLANALDERAWAVEQPGPAGAWHVLAGVVDCLPAPIDGAGALPDQIPEAAGAVLLTPSHHYPTGSLMPPERRRAVLDACRTAGRWLVEDDYDSHLAAPGVVPAAVQALAPDSVIVLGSLSKLLAPGLRIGWLVAPSDVGDRLRELRQRTDLGGSVAIQLTVAELIASGELGRHLRRSRAEYSRRRKWLAAALAPRWRLSGAPVGVHAYVRTNEPEELVERLAAAGVPCQIVPDEGWTGVIVSVGAFRSHRSAL